MHWSRSGATTLLVRLSSIVRVSERQALLHGLLSSFREDEKGEDIRYYSTLDQFDALLSSLDERGPEKLLVYRLQKRYEDIARSMQITASTCRSFTAMD